MVYTVINAVARFTGFNYRSIQVCCTTTFFCLLFVACKKDVHVVCGGDGRGNASCDKSLSSDLHF